MSSSKQARGAAKKKPAMGEDGPSSKRNNVAVGTLVEVKSPDNERTETKQGGEKPLSYIYRDFGKVNDEDFDVDYEIEQEGLLKVCNLRG